VLQEGLGPARGLLRRPTRASTPRTCLAVAVAQDDDLDLVLDCVLHLHSLIDNWLLLPIPQIRQAVWPGPRPTGRLNGVCRFLLAP
jgi:hypothetical protein